MIHLPESIGFSEAAMAETKAAKRGTGKRKAGGAGRSSGRIQVRRDTAEYRAAAQEQASRVREEIDTALADARRKLHVDWSPASAIARYCFARISLPRRSISARASRGNIVPANTAWRAGVATLSLISWPPGPSCQGWA